MQVFTIFLIFFFFEVTHQLPITRPAPTLLQLNEIRSKTFDHRKQNLAATSDFRMKMSSKIEDYFTRTMNVIEQHINIIASSDTSTQELLAHEPSGPCITNIKTMVESAIESSGYYISNCITDVDGIASTAFRSFYQVLDVYERDFNLEPSILTNALYGRNIFTQSKQIITRAQSQLNAKVTLFDGHLAAITQKLSDVTAIYEEQINILDTCFKSVEDSIVIDMEKLSNLLPTCQKFSKV